MSAPGYTPIQLYYSTTASAVPSASDLITAELAVNVTDKKVYTKDGGGSVITLVGTLGNQNANAVAITGGTINSVVIGGSTPAAATVTTLTATSDSSFTSTGAVKLSTGTTGERPGTASAGMIRFNSDTPGFEGYNGSAWGAIGGSGGATGGGSNKVFYLNDQTVSVSYSIPSGQNAMCTGTLTINSGVTVTVPSGSRWVVL